MPQSANDQVEPPPRSGDPSRQRCFNASVGKRSSGTNRGAAGGDRHGKFQCLSRQTIKWNVMPALPTPVLVASFNASVGKRSSGTHVDAQRLNGRLRFNASVGKRSSGTAPLCAAASHQTTFQCLSRQTIKWNRVLKPGGVATLSFQCLSRQTIKWNKRNNHDPVALDDVSMPQSANDQVEPVAGAVGREQPTRSFNASVGKRSSGTRIGGKFAKRASAVSMPQSANDQVEHG